MPMTDALIDIVLHTIYFHSSADETMINEDAAIAQLDAIAQTLAHKLTDEEKQQFLAAIAQRLQKARAIDRPKTRQDNSWEEFLANLPLNLGL